MTTDRRYQVFVSSTSHDLKEQRQKIWETLVSLDFIVSGMEAFPATSDAQFEYIKQQISQSDYYILVIAGRYGTVLEDGTSYTEKEFDFAQEEKIPTLVFLHKDIGTISIANTDQDSTKMERLKLFREKASRNRLCSLWTTADELALNVVKSLQAATKSHPRPGWQRGDTTNSIELLTELRELRLENDKLKSEPSLLSSEPGLDASESDFRKSTSYSFTFSGPPEEFETVQLTPRAILNEISIFEPTTFDVFEECVRGAIAAKTGHDFEKISIGRAETDRAILLLAKMRILQISRSTDKLVIQQGINWLAANTDAKLNR
jgi:hypothetical protein